MIQRASACVSVVIPCFRCTNTIDRALHSVLRQTLPPTEIILIDDFSGDGTFEILLEWHRRYPRLIKAIGLSQNGGAGAARNAGLAIATQPYIAFLDADDSWHPLKLEVQHAFMQANPSTSLCGHLCTMHDDGEFADVRADSLVVTSIPKLSWLFKNAFSTPTVMMKRDLPYRFEDARRYSEDFLLWQQIAFAGHSVFRIEAPLASVHKPFYGAGGLSAQLWKMERGELDNFSRLRKDGTIGPILFFIASGFSLLKYFRRYLLIKLRRVPRVAGQ